MLIQHRVIVAGSEFTIIKEKVKEVNFGSIKEPTDVEYFEYSGRE
jgi:hypothetical protein